MVQHGFVAMCVSFVIGVFPMIPFCGSDMAYAVLCMSDQTGNRVGDFSEGGRERLAAFQFGKAFGHFINRGLVIRRNIWDISQTNLHFRYLVRVLFIRIMRCQVIF